MGQGKLIYRSMMISQNRQGVVLLMMSLIAGIIGGLLGLLDLRFTEAGVARAAHGELLEFYVIIPSFIGGLGRILLPSAMGRPEARFHPIDWVAVYLLVIGIGFTLAPLSGFTLGSACSLVFWSLGVAILGANTIIFILENRRMSFTRMGCMGWCQLVTSAATIVVTPVTTMLALRMVPVSSASESLLTAILSLPLQAMAVTATIGMMSSAFFADDHAPSLPFTALISFIGLGIPLIWLKFFTMSEVQTGPGAMLWLTMPSIVVMASFIRQLWEPVRRDVAAIIWSFGAMLLMVAGWIMDWGQPVGEAGHPGTLFAAICALFGSFYAWQRARTEVEVSPLFGISHFSTFFSGVFLSVSPWPATQTVGHLLMSLCLGFVGVLLLRLTLPKRNGREAHEAI